MKNSIINDIFNGVRGSIETIVPTPTNKDNLKEVAAAYDKLQRRFTAKQLKLIDKFIEVFSKNHGKEIDLYYTEGFKLGLRLAVECFEDN